MISPLVLADDDDDGDNSATTLRGEDIFDGKSSAITCCGNLDSTFFRDTIGKTFFGIACGMVGSDLSVELSLIISSSRDFIFGLIDLAFSSTLAFMVEISRDIGLFDPVVTKDCPAVTKG